MSNNNGKIVEYIPMSDIHKDPNQPKAFDLSNEQHRKVLADLTEDIKERGQLEPIVAVPFYENGDGKIRFGKDAYNAKDRKFWIGNGHKRMYVAEKLHKDKIWASIEFAPDMRSLFEIQFVTGAKGISLADYNGWDACVAIQRYIEEFMKKPKTTEDEALSKLVKMTGFSRTFFEGRLDILKVSKGVQNKIKRNEVKVNMAPEILHNIPKEYKHIAEDEVEKNNTVNVLDMRPAGRRAKEILEKQKKGEISQEKAERLVRTAIQQGGRDPEYEKSAKVNENAILLAWTSWKTQVERQPLDRVSVKLLDEISSIEQEISDMVRNAQKLARGITKRGQLKKAKAKTRGHR